jgi:ribonuclease D
MEGLQQLLQDNGTVKIMHDCRQAAAVLFYEQGVTIQNVFDTQVLSKKRTAKLMCTDHQKNYECKGCHASFTLSTDA